MLGGDDEVLHPRVGGGLRPEFRVIQVGIEVLEVSVIDLVGNLLALLDPLMAGWQGVDSPVDEQAEAVVGEPTAVADGWSDIRHGNSSWIINRAGALPELVISRR